MKLRTLALLVVLGTFLSCKQASGAKILAISFFATKSHKITYEPLLRELARRGHNVTVYTPLDGKNETNFRNVKVMDSDQVMANLHKDTNMFDIKLKMPGFLMALFNPLIMMTWIMRDICPQSYELPQVKQLLDEKYDLVFFTPIGNECVWGLLHKLNAPVVIYQQMAIFPWIAGQYGTPSPTSFVSSPLIGYSGSGAMTFTERLLNFLQTFYDTVLMDWYYLPVMEKAYREALKDPTIPSVPELMKTHTGLVLTNSHISFNKPRPMMQDIIEVGGLHLIPAKPVPKELDDFLSGGKDGFIFFSMGSALKSSTMPERYRMLFLNVFSKLKQRVIWKWEAEMDDLPPNVKTSKWLPQQDVLGHKDIRLFITHGGMGSTAEAIYHGVPLVGIPMLGDQPSNMAKSAELGFALPPLDFATLTEEILLDAINIALTDPKYQNSAKRLSSIFLDQQTKPMDRAVYWIEYVLRHKGAHHLRSAARDLGYISYFSLDVIAILLVVFLVGLKVNVIIVKALYRKICRPKKTFGSMKKVN